MGGESGTTGGVGTGANGTGATPGTGAAQGSNGSTNNGSGLNNNNGGAGNAGNGSNQNGNNGGNNAELERLIQSAVDRATQRLGTENKELRSQIQQLQQLNMTDNERYEHELSEREKAVKAGEAAIKAEKNRMYAITAIKNAGLDDGSADSIALIDLVVADDEKGIDAKVEALNTLVSSMVQKKVNATFAENGRNPAKGSNDADRKDNKIELGKQLGQRQASADKKAQSILDLYTGG